MRWLQRLVWIALFLAALVLGWTFARRNEAPLHLDYLAGTLDAPAWAILLGAALLGALASALFGGWHAARLALTARRYRKLASGLEQEVHELRTLPLGPPDDAVARGGTGRPGAAGGLGRSG